MATLAMANKIINVQPTSGSLSPPPKTVSRALQPQHYLGSTTKCSAACSWDPSIPIFQDVPTSDPLETQAIMGGRCLGRDGRRSPLPVRHHQAVIKDASAVRCVGVESPRGYWWIQP